MNKTVKKVLGIGIFFGIFVFSSSSVMAKTISHAKISTVGDPCKQLKEGYAESKDHTESRVFNCVKIRKSSTESCEKRFNDIIVALEDLEEKSHYKKVKRDFEDTCEKQEKLVLEEKIDKAESACEKIEIEVLAEVADQTMSKVKNWGSVCAESAKVATCEKTFDDILFQEENKNAEKKNVIRKFKNACEDDAKIYLAAAENGVGLGLEEAGEYAPFGVYEGPAFGGPGLKAGSRIAKSKLDNTISKEESIKKLAIGWVNLALSLVAILAVIAVIYAGILYITSMGDDGNKDKAKNIIMYVALGILLIFGSYAIVKALLSVNTGNVSITYLIAEIFV